MSLLVKICGLSTEASVEAAVEAGADMLGFVFHPKSPRYVDWQTANLLGALVPPSIVKVALLVNESDLEIDMLNNGNISPDLLQLHGNADGLPQHLAETPERVAQIKANHDIPVMKAIGVAAPDDLAIIPGYAAVADRILLDAKPPKGAAYPGGHGRAFDWNILASLPPGLRFMLSGGLDPDNVGTAIRKIRGMGLALAGVDVSSGVESAPGVKDPGRIRAFVAAARAADNG